ncbi:MAG: lytic murein transglycosylase B [Pseudomonadota bacterium]
MIKHTFLLTILMGSAIFLTSVHADEAMLQKSEVQAFIQEMVTHDHFSRPELETIFKNVQPMPEVVHHMNHPAEAFPWDTYKNLFVTQARVDKGVAFSFAHQSLLNQTESTYQVPGAIIVAILGVESNYGTHVMKYRAIDSLSHLAFNYPSRQAFFSSQLRSFLLLTRKYDLNINQIYGSYAGAIGPAQFMPDSIMSYAVITHKDLDLNVPENWIPSIANYFHKKGWKAGEPVLTSIECPAAYPETIIPNSMKHFYSPQVLRDTHISNKAKQDAMFLEFKSASGTQCWLAYHNFSVIMRYNTSPLYAMAVLQLSEKLTTSFGDI